MADRVNVELPSDDNGLPSPVGSEPEAPPASPSTQQGTAKAAPKKRIAKKPAQAKAKAGPKKKPSPASSSTEQETKKKHVYKQAANPANGHTLRQMKGDGTIPGYIRNAIGEINANEILSEANQDDFMEMFSPARIVPVARSQNLRAIRSMDLTNGWNLALQGVQIAAVKEVQTRCPKVIMMGPPCTMFSKLQDTNWSKMDADYAMERMKNAVELLDFAIWIAKLQMESGRGFVIEHPHNASSWKRPEMQELINDDRTQLLYFDQCMFGLVTKVDEVAIKKPTFFLTNVPQIANRFKDVKCLGLNAHRTCQGIEGGERRSTWAQRYPPALCSEMVAAIKEYVGV